VCIQLAEFLRYSLTYSKKEYVSVKEEVDHLKNYLGVEKIRLGKRLQTVFCVDDALINEPILSFSIQPLIENAIKHGIEESLEGGTISLDIKKQKDYIFIQVSNPVSTNAKKDKPGGHGLPNLRSRLSRIYGEDAKILAHQGEAAFSVKLYLPYLKNISQEND